MRPDRNDDGSSELRLFLKDVIRHFMNRTSQREKFSFRRNEIHERVTPYIFDKEIPEFIGGKKLIPDEVFVVVGYYNSEKHLEWIRNKKLCNDKDSTGRGGGKHKNKRISAANCIL